MQTFFFDTYALYELIIGSENYKLYQKGAGILFTRFQLMELHYAFMRTIGQAKADEIYDALVPFVIGISDHTIKKANALKYFYRKRKLSYIDCIGYVLARKNGFPFLTGDEQFRDLEGVEFVK